MEMALTEERSMTPPGWGARVVMLGGGLLSALALMAITSVLPKIEADLAHSPRDSLLIKQLVGIVGLAMVVGAPLAGFLVDRLGLRRVLVTAALVYAVSGTAGLYLSGLPLLVASRFFVGLAAATIQIISITLINTRLEGAERAKWMGVHISIAMIGTIFVHPIVGFIGEFGWRWPFALYAVGLLLVPVAWMEKPATPQTSADNKAKSNAMAKGPGLLSWFPFRYAVMAILIGSISYLPMIHVPFLLRQHGVTSPSVISWILTADSLAGAGMAMLYGRARRHYSAHAAFAFSFACTGLGTLIAAYASSVTGVFGGLLVFGLGVGWLVPNLMTALSAKVTQDQQGRAAGLVKAAHFLSAPICIALMEPFARQYGSESAMFAISLLAFSLLIIVGIRIAKEHRSRSKIMPVTDRLTAVGPG